MNKYPIIRRIYLYLFAFIGLVLITIGCVRLVSLALKTYIFKQADIYYEYPPTVKPVSVPEGGTSTVQREPTQEEIDKYQQKQRTSNRQREAAESIAFMLVGVPLYFYHWRMISRDKRQETSDQ